MIRIGPPFSKSESRPPSRDGTASLSSRGLPFPAGLALTVCLASCLTTEEGPDFRATPTELSFPQSKHLVERGEYHNVFILTESPTPTDYARPAIPKRVGIRELLDFGLDHQLEYYNQAFHVGRDRYPSSADSLLYVFMEVEGDWSFVYRGVHFSIERPGRWKPAILQRRIYARGPSRELAAPQQPAGGRYRVQQGSRRGRSFTSQQKQLLGEELRISTHAIQFENGKELLSVNGNTYAVTRGSRFTIDRKGNVTAVDS